jgi:hypothetical protein
LPSAPHRQTCASETAASQNAHALALVPPRRVELPSDGLRDRCITVVLQGRIEQVTGVEPAWVCVAHKLVTRTHLLGGAVRHLWFRVSVGSNSAFVTRAWARSDSNRRFVWVRTRCNPGFATDPQVPPSGIEPEPLGLQPSAQTNYARVGYECCTRALQAHVQHQIIIVIIFGCHRAHQFFSRSGRTKDAPRALMQSLSQRAHLSRFEICIQISSRKSLVVRRPETSKGRPVSRRYPYRAHNRDGRS